MFESAIKGLVELRTGIATEKQHTQLNAFSDFRLVSTMDGITVDCQIDRLDKAILEQPLRITFQNQHIALGDADDGQPMRCYPCWHVSDTYAVVTPLDIIVEFERFIHDNAMQDYGNVIVGGMLSPSISHPGETELQVQFE